MKLRNVSASQVELFERCQRWWHYDRVKGLRGPSSPAMLRGSSIHSVIEQYLLWGVEDTEHEHYKFLVAAKPFLPAFDDRVLVEKEIIMPTRHERIPWLGYIDLLEPEMIPLRVGDYKSTSDFRYCKTPEELTNNTQLISYSKWCYDQGYVGDIELRHLYLNTRRKTPTTRLVEATVEQPYVLEQWEQRLDVVDNMVAAAAIDDTNTLPPTVTACGMYGGCPHRARCGITDDMTSPFQRLHIGQPKKKASTMSFLNKLKAKQVATGGGNNGQASEAPIGAGEPTTHVPTGVLPPEAPSRETEIETASETQPAADPPKKEKRGRKKMTEAEKAKAKAERAAKKAKEAAAEAERLAAAEVAPKPQAPPPPPAEDTAPSSPSAEDTASSSPSAEDTAPATPDNVVLDADDDTSMTIGATQEGLVLYIDCIPVRGSEFTLFEDWFRAVADKITEDSELPDYRLLPFAQEKAAVTLEIARRYNEGDLPDAIVISSGAMGAKDAMSALIPLATMVIRSIR